MSSSAKPPQGAVRFQDERTDRRFYLGSHQPSWLERVSFPLFISRRRLAPRKRLPRARGPWALDSGGFTEIHLHGRFTVSPARYAAEVRRFRDEVGRLAWAAPQDWMCEPASLARTGLTVQDHQRRTISNFLELKAIAPDVPWLPVLQGWAPYQYFSCVELYLKAGIDLSELPLVGVGSVCRRQSGMTAAGIFRGLATLYRLRLHGFGVKTSGLRASGDVLVSADSMAWSAAARWTRPLPGHQHASCSSCLDFAILWRQALPTEWTSIASIAE
jgi:hypothetical protein